MVDSNDTNIMTALLCQVTENQNLTAEKIVLFIAWEMFKARASYWLAGAAISIIIVDERQSLV